MINNLSSPEGGMYSSFSAVDEEGIEGAYYVWTNEELTKLLTADELKVIKFFWSMKGPYPIDEGYIPVIAYTEEEVAVVLKGNPAEIKKLISQAKLKLLKARKKRQLPIDTKQLASWNSLVLSALSQAGRLNNNAKYIDAAQRLHHYIITTLWDGNKLFRAQGKSGSLGDGKLEDYAYVAEGLLEYAKLSKKDKDYQLAKKVIEAGWKRFFNDTGWHLTDKLLLPIDSGQVLLEDGALPSASAKIIAVSLELADKFKDKQLRNRALGALNNGHDLIDSSPFAYASTIATLATYQTK